MKRIFAAVALSTLMLGGCGSDPEAPGASEQPKDQSDAKTVLKVGDEIEAGVYTAPAHKCNGFAATTREYDLEPEETVGEFVGASVLVGQVDRIVLYDGQYFHSQFCPAGTWKREDGKGPKSIDPATVKGACALLIDEGLLAGALEFPKAKETDEDEFKRGDIQERIFSIGTASMFSEVHGEGSNDLAPVTGQLVDFLDDPKAYVEDGKLTSDVAGAVAKIKKTCE